MKMSFHLSSVSAVVKMWIRSILGVFGSTFYYVLRRSDLALVLVSTSQSPGLVSALIHL